MNITYSIFLRPFVLCFCILSINTHAQFHEIGLFLGGSNYIGDIGSDQYVKPNAPAFGLLYKWNITERYSLRGGISISKLTEKETNILIYLSRSNNAVGVDQLQSQVWQYHSNLETHTVETHIYRLRKKILNIFNDNEFIISKKNGYQIK